MRCENPLEKEMAILASILAWEITFCGQKTQWDTIHGVTRVGHHFATKPPPPTWYTLNHRYYFLRQQDLFKSSYVYSVQGNKTRCSGHMACLVTRLRSDFHPWRERRLPIFPGDRHQADCTNNTARLPHPVIQSALLSPASCLTEAEPCGPDSSAS